MDEGGRPAGGGNGGGGSHGLTVRNMADIARMFLEGARPNAPVRTSSGGGRVSPQRHSQEPARANAEQVIKREPAEGMETAAFLAFASPAKGSGADAWSLLLQTARGLSDEQATSVAVVGILGNGAKRTFVADVVGVESVEELPVIRAGSDASPDGQGNMPAVDMQIARALHRLKPAVGMWLIAAPEPESHSFPAIASIVRNWLLACPTDNEGLVAGYQHLKKAWVKAAPTAGTISPGVYLLSHDYAHAAVVHKRLRKAALEFLRTDLPLAGAGPVRGGMQAGAGRESIRIMAMASDGPEDVLWAAVLDELCPMNEAEDSPVMPAEALRQEIARAEKARGMPSAGDVEQMLEQVQHRAAEVASKSAKASEAALDHLAQVLDPEERQALSLAFDDAPGEDEVEETASGAMGGRTVSPVREEPVSPPVIKTRAPARERAERGGGVDDRAFEEAVFGVDKAGVREAAKSAVEPLRSEEIMAEAGGAVTLRAFELEDGADRKAQWQAVEKSVWDLSPRSALLDAKPPMSWATETCLSIDASGSLNVWTLYKDGASWFALREWAHEHRNLLALTRRDLTVRREAEVAVHIILPLEEEVGKAAIGVVMPNVVSMMMRTPVPHVHLYRLRRVQWANRRGLVVVPIS